MHRSLLAADNALGVQSNDHPDGWGVAFYVDGAPHLMRNPATALGDQIFHRLSGVVASETVLAHVRRATVGPINVLNCHPFQYGYWTMAHNGEVRRFAEHRAALIEAVTPRLRRFILGDTDSEVFFYLFLTHLEATGDLAESRDIGEVVQALRQTIAFIRSVCDREGVDNQALLTVVVTNGSAMVAVHGGKELFWSSYKNRCTDRDECPYLAPGCEAPSETGLVNHLIFSSEPLQGENVWVQMVPGEILGVDAQMRLHRATLDAA